MGLKGSNAPTYDWHTMPAPKLPILLIFAAAAAAKPALHFDLSKIAPTDLYSTDAGYGYEKPATGNPPYYFSAHVPEEGNYRVTVKLGAKDSETTTTIKAELRRLMVEKVNTAPGKFESRTFIVNVRRPQIAGGGEVRLKDREKTNEAWAWDDKLTLEFTNSRPDVYNPGVSTIDIEKA